VPRATGAIGGGFACRPRPATAARPSNARAGRPVAGVNGYRTTVSRCAWTNAPARIRTTYTPGDTDDDDHRTAW
jgi:hypothetical protein